MNKKENKNKCKDGKHDWMFEPVKKDDNPVCFRCYVRYLDIKPNNGGNTV